MLHLFSEFCRNEEVVTYGIRAGSTRDLGFTTASIDMIMFDYSVADRVDCVCAGNCWSPVLIMLLPILYHKDLHFHTQYHSLLALL